MGRSLSPFVADGPPLSGCEIVAREFPLGPSATLDGVPVYTEAELGPRPFQGTMLVYWDSNVDSVQQSGERSLYTYRRIVIVSTDATYLRQLYDKTSPDPYELVLFLEDNRGDSFSGSTALVRIGSSLARDTIGRIEREEDLLGDLRAHFGEDAIEFSAAQLEELISENEITNLSATAAIGLLQVMNWQSILFQPVYEIVGDGLLAFTKLLRDYCQFQAEHWDPMFIPEGVEADRYGQNPDFDPAILGGFGAQRYAQATLSENVAAVRTSLNRKRDELLGAGTDANGSLMSGALAMASSLGLTTTGEGHGAFGFIGQILDALAPLFDALEGAIVGIVEALQSVGRGVAKVINAYLCGLWNSVVDIVLFPIELIGYFFWAAAAVGGFMLDAQTIIPQVLELIDEGIQALASVDFSAVLAELVAQLRAVEIDALAQAADAAGGITRERVAYFVGCLVGFVLEILLELVLTGGVAAVETLLTRLGSFTTNVAEGLARALKKFFGPSLRAGTVDIVSVIGKCVGLLKRGTSQLVDLVKALFAGFGVMVRVSEEVLVEIVQHFRLPPRLQEKIKRLGLAFIRFDGETATLCRLTS